MKVHSVRHPGLRRLIESDDDSGIEPALVDAVRRALTVLIAAPDWTACKSLSAGASEYAIEAIPKPPEGGCQIIFFPEDGDMHDLDLEYHR